jgi:dienelactone hydrolase
MNQTTLDPEPGAGVEAGIDFGRRGPHPVGVLETAMGSSAEPDRSLPTEIWYPAVANGAIAENAPHPFGSPHRAAIGLPAIDAPCPLLVFSHGNSGMRHQSTFLMTHLASWGFVVAAPDHVGNTFAEMLALSDDEARRETHRRIRRLRPVDLHAVLRGLCDEGHLADCLPGLDPARLGVLGHSFGGWTAFKMPALDPRVRSVCGLAPASEPFVGRKAFEASELPLPGHVEALVLAAHNDVLVDLETSIRPLARRLGPRSRLDVIDRADHFHFCDEVELLHRMHKNNPRDKQLQPTLPYSDLRPESEMHSLVTERVTRFFAESLTVPISASR